MKRNLNSIPSSFFPELSNAFLLQQKAGYKLCHFKLQCIIKCYEDYSATIFLNPFMHNVEPFFHILNEKVGKVTGCKPKTLITHFQPMFQLWINQVVGFYYQNVWKTPVKEWHFKWRCRSSTCIFAFNCLSSTSVFQIFW